MDVRSCRGPNCDSDHFLVKATVRERTTVVKLEIAKRKKLKLVLLKNEGGTQFQDTSERSLARVDDAVSVEAKWSRIKESIKETADSVLGEVREAQNEDWFDEECENALDEKNVAWEKMN